MGSTSALSLCRVCLIDGATCQIFSDADDTYDGEIYSKLSICLHEKVEDKVGYPRNICTSCNETLNLLYDFVTKYSNSSKIIESGAFKTASVKKENITTEYDHCFTEVYFNVETKYLPEESENDVYQQDSENTKDIFSQIVEKKQRMSKKISKVVKVAAESKGKKSKPLNVIRKTGSIASSFLEGSFAWDGENWSESTKNKRKRRRTVNQELKTTQKPPVKEKKLPKEKPPKAPLLCDLCGASFNQIANLTVHRQVKHFPENIPCPHCEYFSINEANLERHIRRKHTKLRDYICSECGKGFAFQNDLNGHAKLHQRDKFPKKRYSCNYCEKEYNSKQSVTIHERSVHTGDRPAECPICQSRFFHKTYLTEHMRLHTGATPYKCPVCSRGYAQAGNMKSHIRNTHRLSHLDEATLSKFKPSILKHMKP